MRRLLPRPAAIRWRKRLAVPVQAQHVRPGDRVLIGGVHAATVRRSYALRPGDNGTWLLVLDWDELVPDDCDVWLGYPWATVRLRWWRPRRRLDGGLPNPDPIPA